MWEPDEFGRVEIDREDLDLEHELSIIYCPEGECVRLDGVDYIVEHNQDSPYLLRVIDDE